MGTIIEECMSSVLHVYNKVSKIKKHLNIKLFTIDRFCQR